MKRYISAVLAPCLLLNLFGCYSMKEVSLSELSKEEDELIINTKDSTVYFLQKNSTAEEIIKNSGSYFSDKWIIRPDSIIMFNAITYNQNIGSTSPFYKTDSIKIGNDAVTKVMADRYDTGKTVLLIVGLIAVSIAIGFLLPENEIKLDIPPIPNPFHY